MRRAGRGRSLVSGSGSPGDRRRAEQYDLPARRPGTPSVKAVAAGQIALAIPPLEGLDGTQKMSKSLGNRVGIHGRAEDVHGKFASVSHQLMQRDDARPSACTQSPLSPGRKGDVHPSEARKNLAQERFRNPARADEAARFLADRLPSRSVYPSAPEVAGLRELDLGAATRGVAGQVKVDGETFAVD